MQNRHIDTQVPRAKQVQDRRDTIVRAAEVLIRETGSTDFPMLVLAKRAGLSPATPYNLFGTKAAILYALLNASADRMFAEGLRATGLRDPLRQTLACVDALAKVLTGDPAFYRPLYAFLFGVAETRYRPEFMRRSIGYWREATAGLTDLEGVPSGVIAEDIARQLIIQAIGSVELWVHGELDDQQLSAQLKYGCCLMLLGLAPPPHQATLRSEVGKAAAQLRRIGQPGEP